MTYINTRKLAARVIGKVIHEGHLLTAELDKVLTTVESPQDRSFIQALCYGVCRYYHRLEFILTKLIDKPLKNHEVKALIMVGLYQLGFMRVKSHAAVSETVRAAKNISWSKGLINAVLRNYIRRKDDVEQSVNASKTAAYSHPEWLIRQLQHDWPVQADNIMLENNRQTADDFAR